MSKVRIRIFVQRIQVNDFVAVVYIQSHLIIKCLSLVTRKSVFEWSIRPAGRTFLRLLSWFTVHGSRFTVHSSRFTIRGSRFTIHS